MPRNQLLTLGLVTAFSAGFTFLVGYILAGIITI